MSQPLERFLSSCSRAGAPHLVERIREGVTIVRARDGALEITSGALEALLELMLASARDLVQTTIAATLLATKRIALRATSREAMERLEEHLGERLELDQGAAWIADRFVERLELEALDQAAELDQAHPLEAPPSPEELEQALDRALETPPHASDPPCEKPDCADPICELARFGAELEAEERLDELEAEPTE